MNKFKKESGITLIALIITIIILVILAAVTIRAVTNMKIVDYAMNGTQNYVKAGKAENKTLDDTVSFIDEAVAKVEKAAKGNTDLEKLEEYFVKKTDIWDDENNTYANKEPIMDASTSIEYILGWSSWEVIKYNNKAYKLTLECYDETYAMFWVTKVEDNTLLGQILVDGIYKEEVYNSIDEKKYWFFEYNNNEYIINEEGEVIDNELSLVANYGNDADGYADIYLVDPLGQKYDYINVSSAIMTIEDNNEQINIISYMEPHGAYISLIRNDLSQYNGKTATITVVKEGKTYTWTGKICTVMTAT